MQDPENEGLSDPNWEESVNDTNNLDDDQLSSPDTEIEAISEGEEGAQFDKNEVAENNSESDSESDAPRSKRSLRRINRLRVGTEVPNEEEMLEILSSADTLEKLSSLFKGYSEIVPICIANSIWELVQDSEKNVKSETTQQDVSKERRRGKKRKRDYKPSRENAMTTQLEVERLFSGIIGFLISEQAFDKSVYASHFTSFSLGILADVASELERKASSAEISPENGKELLKNRWEGHDVHCFRVLIHILRLSIERLAVLGDKVKWISCLKLKDKSCTLGENTGEATLKSEDKAKRLHSHILPLDLFKLGEFPDVYFGVFDDFLSLATSTADGANPMFLYLFEQAIFYLSEADAGIWIRAFYIIMFTQMEFNKEKCLIVQYFSDSGKKRKTQLGPYLNMKIPFFDACLRVFEKIAAANPKEVHALSDSLFASCIKLLHSHLNFDQHHGDLERITQIIFHALYVMKFSNSLLLAVVLHPQLRETDSLHKLLSSCNSEGTAWQASSQSFHLTFHSMFGENIEGFVSLGELLSRALWKFFILHVDVQEVRNLSSSIILSFLRLLPEHTARKAVFGEITSSDEFAKLVAEETWKGLRRGDLGILHLALSDSSMIKLLGELLKLLLARSYELLSNKCSCELSYEVLLQLLSHGAPSELILSLAEASSKISVNTIAECVRRMNSCNRRTKLHIQGLFADLLSKESTSSVSHTFCRMWEFFLQPSPDDLFSNGEVAYPSPLLRNLGILRNSIEMLGADDLSSMISAIDLWKFVKSISKFALRSFVHGMDDLLASSLEIFLSIRGKCSKDALIVVDKIFSSEIVDYALCCSVSNRTVEKEASWMRFMEVSNSQTAPFLTQAFLWINTPYSETAWEEYRSQFPFKNEKNPFDIEIWGKLERIPVVFDLMDKVVLTGALSNDILLNLFGENALILISWLGFLVGRLARRRWKNSIADGEWSLDELLRHTVSVVNVILKTKSNDQIVDMYGSAIRKVASGFNSHSPRPGDIIWDDLFFSLKCLLAAILNPQCISEAENRRLRFVLVSYL